MNIKIYISVLIFRTFRTERCFRMKENEYHSDMFREKLPKKLNLNRNFPFENIIISHGFLDVRIME